jgi:hypothetical protein
MQCSRCDGLMVSDHFLDIKESSQPMWMRGWRCLSCGNVIDPLILKHRMAQHPVRAGVQVQEVPVDTPQPAAA